MPVPYTNPDLTMDLTGQVALVTGGASGIGAAVTEALARKGARVIIADLLLDEAKAQADRLGSDHFAIACDVADAESVSQAVADAIAQAGRIDLLVNSAGIARLAPAESIGLDQWRATIDVNLTGTFQMSQAVGRHMLERGSGKIVNLASQAGTVAIDEHVAYCASKFGVIGLTKVLAAEWAPRGVTVNSVSPTVVLTDLGRKAWENEKGDALKAVIPSRRFAFPDEIAAAIVFLASNNASMINGADLLVDGGYTIQ